MRYLALTSQEDGRTLVAFPDCPGCQTEVEAGEELQAIAREAL